MNINEQPPEPKLAVRKVGLISASVRTAMRAKATSRLEAVIRNPEGGRIARCLLTRGRYIIGHDRRNEIVVDEPSISGKHARLTILSETDVRVEDLASANGTFVDGTAITAETSFGATSRVSIGRCTLELQRAGLPAAIFDWLPEGFLRPNRYNLGEVIVEGNNSLIYQAWDGTLCRQVALRMLRPEVQSRPVSVLRFIREAQVTSQIQHPGVLPVFDMGTELSGNLYYTTRFVEGLSLGAILDAIQGGNEAIAQDYSLTTLIGIFQRVCETVCFAHSRGVIHAALRPECIEVGSFGEVFVVHWSNARTLPEGAEGVHQPVQVPPVETPYPLSPYTAPEQLLPNPVADVRTDVYALGGILYRILALHPPISESEEENLIARIQQGQIPPPMPSAPPLHLPNHKVPEILSAITMRALNLDINARHSVAAKIIRDLEIWRRDTE